MNAPHAKISELFNLRGRVALVTGGNGGIGLEIARGLGTFGAHVVLVARDPDKGAKAVNALEQDAISSTFLTADVTSEGDCRAAVSRASAELGGIDILVNNAGISVRKAPQEISLDEWNRVISTNLTSAFMMSNAAYPEFGKRGGGKIINITSLLAVRGARFAAAYGASKGGVAQLTNSLATAWAQDNIQVNAILPGWIDTDLTAQAREQVPGLDTKVRTHTPAGRWGRPTDLSGAAIFLASSASDFVTGSAITVDGGFLAQI